MLKAKVVPEVEVVQHTLTCLMFERPLQDHDLSDLSNVVYDIMLELEAPLRTLLSLLARFINVVLDEFQEITAALQCSRFSVDVGLIAVKRS